VLRASMRSLRYRRRLTRPPNKLRIKRKMRNVTIWETPLLNRLNLTLASVASIPTEFSWPFQFPTCNMGLEATYCSKRRTLGRQIVCQRVYEGQLSEGKTKTEASAQAIPIPEDISADHRGTARGLS